MKKLIFILLGVLLLSACDGLQNVEPQKKCSKETPRTPQKWIVEDKDYGVGMRANYRYLDISSINDPTNMLHITVGKHTFEKTNVGDTIIY